ncbi:MAG: DoxX family protein [Bacteroidales bacterium]
MKFKSKTLRKTDIAITQWMASNGLFLLRISIGIIFFWFGILKFFQDASPAEDLAFRTINSISFGLVPGKIIIYGLATWEVLIGIGLIFNIFLRITLLLLYIQMIGTFFPIFLFPGEVFSIFPYSLTIEGQYIIKNIVLVSGGIVLGATVRGGRLKIKKEKE